MKNVNLPTPMVVKLFQFAAILMILWPQEGHAAMEITPRISVGGYYTDNVRLDPEDPESDIVSSITPGITIDVTGRTAGIALSYDASYREYYDDTYDDYWRQAVGLQGWWQAGRRTRFQLSDAFLKTEDPIDNDDLTVRRSRNPYTRNTGTIEMIQGIGVDSVLTAGFEYGYLENEDPDIEDSRRYRPTVGLTYWLNVRWGLDLQTVYTRAEYDATAPQLPEDYDDYYGSLRLLHRFNRHITGFVGYAHTIHKYEYADEDPSLVDYTINDASIGFEYDIDDNSFFSLGVHYFVRDLEDVATDSDDAGVPVNLLYRRAFTRGNVELKLEGGYNYTTLSAENLGYYEFYGGGVDADYEITRRLTGDIFAFYQWRDYVDVPLGREDDVVRAGCGLSYQILRWLSARADYTYRTVESTDEIEDYKENRVTLTFTIEPEKPYRF